MSSWSTASSCAPVMAGCWRCPTRRSRSPTCGRRGPRRTRPAGWCKSTPAASASSSADREGPVGAPARVTPMHVPAQLRYSSDHEWVAVAGTKARVGITEYAQDALGDVVYVQVPDLGASVSAGDSFGEVESTKSVSDVYAPVSGTVVAVNEALADAPETINRDPYGDGWLCEIELADASELEALLDADAYQALLEG